MKLGAEPKKNVAFVALIAVAVIVYWMNSSSDAPSPSIAARPAADASGVAGNSLGSTQGDQTRRQAEGTARGLGGKVFELPNTVDPTKVDPTLHLELLAKVQSIDMEGGVRNIFKTEAPPPEPVAEAKGIPKVDPLHPGQPAPPTAPIASTQAPPPPSGPPPPAPIALKYYGYSTKRSDGEKKAFFLDGEDIIVAAEGDIIKKQYKVVRIGVNSVQMEDTASKSTQTLPLQQEVAPA